LYRKDGPKTMLWKSQCWKNSRPKTGGNSFPIGNELFKNFPLDSKRLWSYRSTTRTTLPQHHNHQLYGHQLDNAKRNHQFFPWKKGGLRSWMFTHKLKISRKSSPG
jgi:hypothetical protein